MLTGTFPAGIFIVLKETSELPLKKRLEQSYLVIGDIYRRINKTDSAYYYLNKTLSSSRMETICADVYKRQGLPRCIVKRST